MFQRFLKTSSIHKWKKEQQKNHEKQTNKYRWMNCPLCKRKKYNRMNTIQARNCFFFSWYYHKKKKGGKDDSGSCVCMYVCMYICIYANVCVCMALKTFKNDQSKD